VFEIFIENTMCTLYAITTERNIAHNEDDEPGYTLVLSFAMKNVDI